MSRAGPAPESQRTMTTIKRRRTVGGLAVGLACWLLPGAQGAEPVVRLSVEAGEHARRDCPVSVELPRGHKVPDPAQLVETTGGGANPVPVQVETGEAPRLAWILSGETPAKSVRQFELRAGSPPKSPELTARADEDVITLSSGDKPIVIYRRRHVVPPADLDPKYGRSGHLHPVYTPGGRIVTDEFPPDHAHQSGIFLAYTLTEFEGRKPDFWNLAGGTGRVRFGRLLETFSGPVFAGFRAEHEHVDLTVPDGKVALREEFDVRVWNTGGPGAGYWLVDLHSTQRTTGESPLKLPMYHYGGAAVRGARSWGGDAARFVTSEGKGRIDGNHARSRWVDLSGPVDGGVAGIAMMTHPDNFRFPEPVRLHPTMPYFVYTPSQLGDWEI